MKQRPRRYITGSEMAGIWDRWEKGDSINEIARDLGRHHSAVQGAMARTGGIRPAARRRSQLAPGPIRTAFTTPVNRMLSGCIVTSQYDDGFVRNA